MEDGREGLVLRVDAHGCEVRVDGAARAAALRGRLYEERGDDKVPVAVGDRVVVSPREAGLAVDRVLPRRNLFCRRAAGEQGDRRQLLAANVDRVVIVNALAQPPFSSIALDRILCACSFADIPALAVLNKVDLAKPKRLARIVATYEAAGVPVLPTSATRGDGVEELAGTLRDRVSVLYGLSGTGKSSLLNAIEPGLGLATRETSAALGSGRHTTTHSRYFELSAGGAVIDTPGVRKFRPHGIPPGELRLHFAELRALGADCRYPGCTHREEPECAVTRALERGELARSRYRSYREILAELERVYGGAGREDAG